MKARFLICLIVGIAATSGGCTWVKLSRGGEQVKLLTPGQAAHCQRLGQTSTQTKARVAGVGRGIGKVAEELETLARNSAADMGGNAVAPAGEAVDGNQRFDVYRCP